MKNSKNNSILSSFVWSYAERITAQLISLILSIVLARILLPKDYGTIALVTVFINVLEAMVSGSFGNALIQKKYVSHIDYDTICIFGVLFSAVLYTLLFVFARQVANFYQIKELVLIIRIMGIRMIISSFNSVQRAYVQKNMKFNKLFYSSISGAIVSAIVGIIMAYSGFGVWALVAQYMISSSVNTIVLFLLCEWKIKLQFSIPSLIQMLPFGMKMLLATLIGAIQDNVRTLVVGKVFSREQLAFYDQGNKYPMVIMENLSSSIQNVFFPVLATNQDDLFKLKTMTRKAIRFSSFILIPVIIGIISIADTFVITVLTPRWKESIPFLRILSLVYLFRPLNAILKSLLLAIGKSGANLIHDSVQTVLGLILLLLSVFVYKNIYFIALSSVLITVVGVFIFQYYVYKFIKYKIREMFEDLGKYFMLSITMGVLVWIVGRLFVTYSFIKLIIQVVIGSVFYFTVAYLLKLDEFDECIQIIKQFIKKYITQK